MLEDVAGAQASGTDHSYFTCPECGQVYRRAEARPQLSTLTDDSHSEYQELCPHCERLDLQGEEPILPAIDQT